MQEGTDPWIDPPQQLGLRFRFEGTSGQVVLWVLCFMAIAAAVKLLW
ncbi:hypothetical protein [Niveibacterium sp. SC-1]